MMFLTATWLTLDRALARVLEDRGTLDYQTAARFCARHVTFLQKENEALRSALDAHGLPLP